MIHVLAFAAATVFPKVTHHPTPASNPAVRTTSTALPSASPVADEAGTKSERRIADATVALAWMTFILALATTAAVIVPLFAAARDRKLERIAALRHLLHVVDFYRRRAQLWSSELQTMVGDAYLSGLDVALASSLSDEIIRAVGPTGVSAVAVRDIMATYEQMVRVASFNGNRLILRDDLQRVIGQLQATTDELKKELRNSGVAID